MKGSEREREKGTLLLNRAEQAGEMGTTTHTHTETASAVHFASAGGVQCVVVGQPV